MNTSGVHVTPVTAGNNVKFMVGFHLKRLNMLSALNNYTRISYLPMYLFPIVSFTCSHNWKLYQLSNKLIALETPFLIEHIVMND